jgi:hypothetical protein
MESGIVSVDLNVSGDEWLSEPQLRERLQYSPATISRLRKRGLPHVGTGRMRRYPFQAVVRWLSQHV